MENSGSAEEKFRHVTEYVDVQIQIIKLQAANKASSITAGAVTSVVIGIIVTLAVVLFSVAFAFYISQLLGSYTKGFLITSGILFLKAILLYIFRKPLLTNGIRNRIITALLSK